MAPRPDPIFVVVSGPPASGTSTLAAAELASLPGHVVEVFCRCTADVAWQRYRTRGGTRHAGHFDHDRTREELWNDEVAEPVAESWPLLDVDTNRPADVAAVVRFVQATLEPR